MIEMLGAALGLATLAGINLYLTVLLTGLVVRFDLLSLTQKYESLQILGNEWVLFVAGGLFVVEFFADKIPWVDSFWDSFHTVIRPIGAVLLSLSVLGDVDPVLSVISTLLAGGAALTTHTAKASGRLLINLSPEPVSNTIASVSEDGMVIAGLGLIAFSPVLAFVVSAILLIFCLFLSRQFIQVIKKSYGGLRSSLGKVRRRVFRQTNA